MMRAALNTLIVALMMLAVAISAQEGTYRLQPEDIIRIQIYNENQVAAILQIGKDGYISAPYVGIVKAAGKTTTELEETLAELYKKRLRLRDPKVSVTIDQYRRVRATIIGAVQRPGTFGNGGELRPTDSILTLLSLGGGPIQGAADLKRATLRHSNSKELIPVDLQAMLLRGDTSQNYTIQDGDELTVPFDTKNRILVLGAVAQPGAYPYQEPMTVVDVLTLARWEIRYRSKLSSVLVIRERPGLPGNYIRMEVNLVRFLKNGDASQNIMVEPGDIIFVPETKNLDIDRLSSIFNILFLADRFSILPFKIFGR